MTSEQARPLSLQPPSPPGPFLIGQALGIQRDPLSLFDTAVATYGDTVRLWGLGKKMWLFRHPDAIRQVLVEGSSKYSIRISSRRMLGHWLGEGLFIIEGAPWRRRRRLMQPLFHERVVQEQWGGLVTAIAEKYSQQVAERAQATEQELLAVTTALTLEVAASAFFSSTLTPEEVERFSRHVTDLVYLYGAWIRSAARRLLPSSLIALHPTFRAAVRELDEVVRRLIAARRAEPTSSGTDLLSRLLRLDGQEGRLSDEEIRDEVMTMLFAGHETTADALAWACYLLATNPDAQVRLVDEASAVLQGRAATVADLPQLAYTRRVVNETLRLYPPAWATFRHALEADRVMGYQVEAGDLVAITPYLLHRHPRYWPDPDRFDPDRFLPAAEAQRPRHLFLPFGAGPRQCLGKHLALMEMPIVLATLLQRVQLEYRGAPIQPEAVLTLRPRGGVPLIVSKRV